ncbi:transposase [Mycolicibacter longobardus]|uniref:Transposase n=1 Tax=Mycolicibacter longobardus TaxID=1108812 RepID=A0A1X1YAM5_9MYCO|nr:transposase [Mycolicibacter longobardus]ORW08116.1 transposase [Mycolicibacter longobardus]
MSAPRSIDGLRKSTDERRTTARKKITDALRDMKRKGMVINTNAVARYANVARKTIYNHPDLFDKIQAARTAPRPRLSAPTDDPGSQSSIVAALREQLRTVKHQYETELTTRRAEIKQLNADLAAAHGEIHRLRSAGAGNSA